jgi:hypothetical protein
MSFEPPDNEWWRIRVCNPASLAVSYCEHKHSTPDGALACVHVKRVGAMLQHYRMRDGELHVENRQIV